MKILVAFEESQVVTKAFRGKGHEAYSCDIKDQSGGHPEWHYRCDVRELLPGSWDMIIAHPPCTYVCRGGLAWLNKRPEWKLGQEKAIELFRYIWELPVAKIAIENPIGKINSMVCRPTQIVYPWMFGHPFSKDICFWLKGLQKLEASRILDPPYRTWDPGSGKMEKSKRSMLKSKTFEGLAAAMAEQWG